MSIKSSLEIALERTKDVQADPENLEASTHIKEGKKIVSRFLSETNFSLKDNIKDIGGKEHKWLCDGIYDALTSNLNLPTDEVGLVRNRRAFEGLNVIISDKKKLQMISKELEKIFAQYLEERQQLKENVDRQYAPKLQQKEEELARRTGARVRLDPGNDPEYAQLLRQQLNLVEDRYGQVLQQVKDELILMYKSS